MIIKILQTHVRSKDSKSKLFAKNVDKDNDLHFNRIFTYSLLYYTYIIVLYISAITFSIND